MESKGLPGPAVAPTPAKPWRSAVRNAASAVFCFFQRQYLFIFCIFLHLLAVVAHLILIVFDYQKHQFLAKETLTTDLIFLAVVMAPTAIVRTYFVVLLLVTQQLALKRNYHIDQSLAALHQKSAAWLGVGSAIWEMWRQRKLRAAPLGVFLVLIYFICLFVLGISTPALITVTYVSDSDPIFAHTTMYLSYVDNHDILDAFPVVNILPLLDLEVFTIGYSAGTVFDVPNFIGQEDVSASAVEFSVDCQAVPGLAQSGDVSSVQRDGTAELAVTYSFHMHPSLRDITVSPAPGTLSILSPKPINTQDVVPPPVLVVVASGIQIVNDTSGSSRDQPEALSATPISPSIVNGDCSSADSCLPTTSVQIVACNVQATNTTVKIDAESAQAKISTSPDPAQWQNWVPPAPPSEAFLAPVGSFADLSPLSDNVRTFKTTIESQTVTSAHNSTLLEDNIQTYLLDRDETSPITLGELNFALERALGVVYWRATFQRALQLRSTPTEGPGSFQVRVNKYTPWIGFATSLTLLVVAIILTRQPMSSPPELDSIGSPGVLQLAWLMGRAPNLADHMSDNVDDPNPDKLLKAGKSIRVKMRDHIEIGRKNTMKKRKSANESSRHIATDGEQKAELDTRKGDAQAQEATLDSIPSLSLRQESSFSVERAKKTD